jgi:hypothetical protein
MYTGRIINDEAEGIQDIDRIVTRHGGDGSAVVLDLKRSLKLRNHSPTGFCWGYGGSGPSQLALAILLDYLKDEGRALGLYMDFKFKVIAGLPMDEDFVLTDQQIESAIAEIEIERTKRNA